jgi:hypothetical protein
MLLDGGGLSRRRSDKGQARGSTAVHHHSQAEELVQHSASNGEGRGYDADHFQNAHHLVHELRAYRTSARQHVSTTAHQHYSTGLH